MGENLSPGRYLSYGAAADLMGCHDTEVLIEGPAGTGKSRAVLQKVHFCARKYDGMRALIVRKTRESMTESVLVTYEEKVLPPNSPVAAGARRNCRQSYEYPNGSCVVVGGMQSAGKDQSAKIMSTEYDLIAAFESTELLESDWEKLLTRLRNGVMPYQQAVADCNPERPSHWLNQRAAKPYKLPPGMEPFLPPARPGQTQMTRLLSRHRDNPALWDRQGDTWTPQGAKYIATLSRLTGARLSRLLDGKWAASEGMVYSAFERDTHVVDPFPIPADWRRFRSIDFGLRNPFVCQFWAVDNDGRMYLYREIYMTERLIDQHARQILQLSEGEKFRVSISDHDLDDRSALAKAGIPTVAAYKSVTVGIQAVEDRLAVAADGKPRLVVFRGCRVERDQRLDAAKFPTCTEEEFDGYTYPPGVDGKPNKEEPVKLHDHGMDSMRYAVAHIDNLAGSRVTLVGAPTISV